MAQTELEDIKSYWEKKYPHISIILYPRPENGIYCGKMMTHGESFDLRADTIGELISQGEKFLRKVGQ